MPVCFSVMFMLSKLHRTSASISVGQTLPLWVGSGRARLTRGTGIETGTRNSVHKISDLPTISREHRVVEAELKTR